jgi:lysophospholipase L1-like esterase
MRRPDRTAARRAITVLAAVALGGAAVLAVMVPTCAAAAKTRPLVVMVGDSTTWGGTFLPARAGVGQAPTDPARVLQALLAMLPEGSAWRGAEVLDFGVPGATTRDWVESFPEPICKSPNRIPDIRVLDVACERRVPLAEAVAAAAGRKPDAILVLLGTNDIVRKMPPEQTVENLVRLRRHLPDAPIYIAPPLHLPAPPGTERRAAIRQGLIDRGLLTGPDWPVLPSVDGVHLTEGGYAAAAGLWLDVLRKQRP